MAALSKHYANIVGNLHCTEIFHPGRTCAQYASENFGKIFQLCAKFYTPMVLAQYVRSSSTLDASVVRDFFQTLLQLTFSTYMGSAVGQSLSCVFYQTVGFPHPLFLIFLPGAIGNTWGFIAPPKVYGLITNGLWTMIFEAFYRLDEVFPLSLVNNSAAFRTLLFMTMSQFILNSKRVQKSDVFWFIKTPSSASGSEATDADDEKLRPSVPSPVMDALVPSERHICTHKESCDHHIYSGAVINFKIGLGIEVVRLLIANIGTLQKRPLQMFGKLLTIKTGLIAFLVGYTSIYRATICALNRRQQKRDVRTLSLAAFVSGAAYISYPNFTILAHATISTIKLMWSRYIISLNAADGADATMKTAFTKDAVRRMVDRLPLAKLFYVLGVGVVFHLRAFYPWMCPNLLLNAVQYTSGFNADQCSLRFSNFLLGFEPIGTTDGRKPAW